MLDLRAMVVEPRALAADEPASRLFHHWEALEHQITDRIVGSGRAAHKACLERLDRYLRIAV